MKLEKIDLHNLSREEAWRKVEININRCIDHGVDVIDIIHGKEHHSQYNFSVIKQEVRQKLKGDFLLFGSQVIGSFMENQISRSP